MFFTQSLYTVFYHERRAELLTEFKPAIITSKNFSAVLQSLINQDRHLSSRVKTAYIKKYLSAKLLYCGDIIQGSHTLLQVPQKYFVLKGLEYQQSSKSKKLTYGIAACFFN